jgi:hypothetical protein
VYDFHGLKSGPCSISWTVGEEMEVRMRSPGKIITGLFESSGTRSAPELQRAVQAWCSSEQIAAVSAGFVSVGVAIVVSVVAVNLFSLVQSFWSGGDMCECSFRNA